MNGETQECSFLLIFCSLSTWISTDQDGPSSMFPKPQGCLANWLACSCHHAFTSLLILHDDAWNYSSLHATAQLTSSCSHVQFCHISCTAMAWAQSESNNHLCYQPFFPQMPLSPPQGTPELPNFAKDALLHCLDPISSCISSRGHSSSCQTMTAHLWGRGEAVALLSVALLLHSVISQLCHGFPMHHLGTWSTRCVPLQGDCKAEVCTYSNNWTNSLKVEMHTVC